MAIVKPDEMSFKDKKFNVILYGAPGVGKTTLALSAPAPLLIDCDRGAGRVRADFRRDMLTAESYAGILDDLQSPEIRNYETIVIDTGGSFVTMLQDWAIAKNPKLYARKDGSLSMQGFGAVKSAFLRFSEMLRVTLDKNVIMVFHSVEDKKDEKTVQRLMCEGSAKNLVWLPCDFGGFVEFGDNGRQVSFAPGETFFAKRTYGIQPRYSVPDLAPLAPNDFLTRLFAEARANIRVDANALADVKRKYAEAVERGREIVSAVTDAESAQAAADSIQALDHAMTSLPEVRALFVRRLAEIGVKYDKARQAYVSIAPPPAPVAAMENPAQADNDAPQGTENPGAPTAAENAPVANAAPEGEAA